MVSKSSAAVKKDVSGSCIPGKKYEIGGRAVRGKNFDFGSTYSAGIDSDFFYGDEYTVLEDGSAIGWVYGHVKKYLDSGAKDFYYNLYRIYPNGSVLFLGAGARDGDDAYVQDGYVYWRRGVLHFKTSIEDESPEIKTD